MVAKATANPKPCRTHKKIINCFLVYLSSYQKEEAAGLQCHFADGAVVLRERSDGVIDGVGDEQRAEHSHQDVAHGQRSAVDERGDAHWSQVVLRVVHRLS